MSATRYRVEFTHPDETTTVFDTELDDEPCVFVATNADEADCWIQDQVADIEGEDGHGR